MFSDSADLIRNWILLLLLLTVQASNRIMMILFCLDLHLSARESQSSTVVSFLERERE